MDLLGKFAEWAPRLPLLCLAVYALATAVAITWVRRSRRRRGPDFEFWSCPGVTILKPVKGVDDGFEENLESFATLEYPKYRLIVAAADAADPALDVARKVAARHPECDLHVMVAPQVVEGNPKVALLAAMTPFTRYQNYLISDSNVLAAPDLLNRVVPYLDDRRVGLVHQPIVGVGEQTPAAAIENVRWVEFCGVWCMAARWAVGVDAVTGKSLLVRKQALADIGGWQPLLERLADDQVLAEKIAAAGWRVKLAPEPVACIHKEWSLRQTVARHSRHAQIRFRLAPLVYLAEFLANPIGVSLLVLLATLGAAWPVVLATIVGKIGVDLVAVRGLRGHGLRPRFWWRLLVKDLLMLGIWFTPFLNRPVIWRGNAMQMTWGTRLAPIGRQAKLAQVTTNAPAAPSRRRAA